MHFDIRTLTPHTGSEILGLDLRKAQDEETKAQLRKAFADRALLCFRGQELAPPDFMRAIEIFGEIMPQQVARFTLQDYPLVGFVSSEDTDKAGPEGKRLIRGEQFHTDHSNTLAPPIATSLCAVTLPSTGGDTQFVNVHSAYDDLPEETKRQIDGLKVLHVFKSSRSPRRKVEMAGKTPEAWQPLVNIHPHNGRKALYLNTAHMERIEGMEADDAFALIDRMMAHVTQPKYEYRHKWRKGDVVIWDNRSLLHQANGDYTEKRFLYRLMVKGTPLQAAA